MPQFNKKEIIAFAVLLAVAIGGVSWYLVQRSSGTTDQNDQQKTMRIVRADHYYQDGIHTYKGMLTVPTPCHEVISQVTVMESHPEQVTIDLKEQGASSFCAQVITQVPFEVSFQASAQARISMNLNGSPVSLKVVEKGSGGQTATSSVPAASTSTVPSDFYLPEGEMVN